MSIIRKQLPTEPRVIDAEKGIVEYVASNETIDGHGDKVLISGWRFDRMEKNAPFLDSHRKGSIHDVLGRVLGARVEDNDLIERVQWAVGLGDPKIDLGFRLTETGYLKAVSVGFEKLKFISKYLDRARKKRNRQFERMVAEFGVSPEEAAEMNTLFVEQRQVELSAVTIGSNPDALLKGFESGVVAEAELAKLGFAEDGAFEFLTKMAEAMESPECTEAMELLIEREMERMMDDAADHSRREAKPVPTEDKAKLYEERNEFLKRLNDMTSDQPGEPSGGCDATRKAHGREELLKALGMIQQN